MFDWRSNGVAYGCDMWNHDSVMSLDGPADFVPPADSVTAADFFKFMR